MYVWRYIPCIRLVVSIGRNSTKCLVFVRGVLAKRITVVDFGARGGNTLFLDESPSPSPSCSRSASSVVGAVPRVTAPPVLEALCLGGQEEGIAAPLDDEEAAEL